MKYKIKTEYNNNPASIHYYLDHIYQDYHTITTKTMVPQRKYIVASHYRGGVTLMDILYAHNIFDTLEQAKTYLKTAHLCEQEDCWSIYIMFEDYIYDVLNNQIEYIKRNNMWISYYQEYENHYTLEGYCLPETINHLTNTITSIEYDKNLLTKIANDRSKWRYEAFKETPKPFNEILKRLINTKEKERITVCRNEKQNS